MATTTSRLGLRKPDPDPITGDFVSAGTDINDNMDNIDGKIGMVPCTSGTRPGAPYNGQMIRETDTGNAYVWNGAAWRRLFFDGPQANWPTFIQVERVSPTGGAFSNFITGNSQSNWFIQMDGKQWWGSGTATHDTNLYRSAPNMLATDDSLTVAGLVIPGSGYFFLQSVYYTGSGTFSKGSFPGIRAVKVHVIGGGGGSGGTPATTAAQIASSGGGGGGGYSCEFILAASLASSETVTVGAGGNGGPAGQNNGSAGGTSSFGAFCSATGGAGGQASAATSNTIFAFTAQGGVPGVGSGGDLNISGSGGGHGWVNSGEYRGGGLGGAAALGYGGIVNPILSGGGAAGVAGLNYGGGAAAARTSVSQATRAGANGAPGLVIVEIYV